MRAKFLFYFCDGIGSVFDSQVLELIKAINEKKFFENVFLFLGIKNEKIKEKFKERNVLSDIEVVYFKSYPNYSLFNIFQRREMKKILNNLQINFNEVIFHTRGELLAWNLSKIINKKYHKNILPDIRGVSIEEVNEYYKINFIFKRLKIFNYKLALKNLNKYNKISVVSNSLKEYLIKNYKVIPNKITINPSIAGKDFNFNISKRREIRNELGINDDDTLLVFSSGGEANWQNYNILFKLAEKGLKILNLSKKVINHKNIMNKFVSYAEMPLYLNAADVGIIWRDESVVNKVSSPVKFSEYICCGLPVISNYSVDMIREYIASNNCGILLKDLNDLDINMIEKLKQFKRSEISADGILKFGIEKIVSNYLEIYSSLN